MPKKIHGKPVNEHKWNKAKSVAAKEGRAEDYAYIMGIYKKMTKSKGSVNMLSIIRKVADLSKSKKYPTGTIRDWKGKKYQKQANGEWHEVKKGKHAGAGGGDDSGGKKGKEPKYVEIGSGLYVMKIGRDSNGNSSIWIAQGSNPAKKIQMNGVLTYKSSIMIEGKKFFADKDKTEVQHTIKQIKSYWDHFGMGPKPKKEHDPAAEGIAAAKADAKVNKEKSVKYFKDKLSHYSLEKLNGLYAKMQEKDFDKYYATQKIYDNNKKAVEELIAEKKEINPAEEGIKAAKSDAYFKNSIKDFIKKHGESEYKPTFQVRGNDDSHTTHISVTIDQLKKLINDEPGALLRGKNQDDSYVKDQINALIKKHGDSEYKPTIKFYGENDAHTNNMDVSIDVLKNAIGEHGEKKKVKGVDDKIFDQKMFGVSDNNEDLGIDGHELMLFLQNDSDLYRQQYEPILKNIARKLYNGKYEHEKAARLWEYIVENAAKKYAKENQLESWHETFPKKTRVKMSQALADEEFEKFKNKEYDIESLRKLNKGEGDSDLEQLIKSWEMDMADTTLEMAQEFMKSIQHEEQVLILNKGRGLPVGTVRDWKGKKFRKVGTGDWKEERHAHKVGGHGGSEGHGDTPSGGVGPVKKTQKPESDTKHSKSFDQYVRAEVKKIESAGIKDVKIDSDHIQARRDPNRKGKIDLFYRDKLKDKFIYLSSTEQSKNTKEAKERYITKYGTESYEKNSGTASKFSEKDEKQIEYFVNKFHTKMGDPRTSDSSTVKGWVDGIHELSKEARSEIFDRIMKMKKSMPDQLIKSINREEEFLRLNRGQMLAIGTVKDDGTTFWEKTGLNKWEPIEKAVIESTEVEPLSKALGTMPQLAVFDNQGDDQYNRFTIVFNGRVYSTDGEYNNGGKNPPSMRLRGKLVKITDDGLLVYSNEQHMYPIGVRVEEVPANVIAAIQAFISGANTGANQPAIAKA